MLFLLFVFFEELFFEELLFLEELLLFGHALLHCELFELILTPPFVNIILIVFLFVIKLLCMFFLIYEKLNMNIVFWVEASFAHSNIYRIKKGVIL